MTYGNISVDLNNFSGIIIEETLSKTSYKSIM